MFQQHPPTPKCFGGCSVKALSIAQVVCGGLAIITGIVLIAVRTTYYFDWSYIGYPIWTGPLFYFSGIVGIYAAKRKTKCLIVAFMVLSILSAVSTIYMLAFSASFYGPSSYCDYDYDYDCSRAKRQTRLAMNGLLILTTLVEVGLAIASSVMACCAVCACCGASGADNCCNCDNTSGFQPPAVAYQVGADGRLVQIPIMQGGQPIAMTSFFPSQPQQVIVLPSGGAAQQLQLVTQTPANMAAGIGPQGNVVLVPAGQQSQGGAPAPHA